MKNDDEYNQACNILSKICQYSDYYQSQGIENVPPIFITLKQQFLLLEYFIVCSVHPIMFGEVFKYHGVMVIPLSRMQERNIRDLLKVDDDHDFNYFIGGEN